MTSQFQPDIIATVAGKILPTPSIILEWENAKLSEADRSARMLAQLSRQLSHLAPRFHREPEIIVLYHEDIIDVEKLNKMFSEAALSKAWAAQVRMLAAPKDLKYYSIKNHGFKHTNREVVVLLDSDVVPEDGWLATLLEDMRDGKVDVVCGETYLDPDSLCARAFALFWFFPARTDKGCLEPATYFFANSVAFRREIFAAHPFPEVELFRGQCNILASKLRQLNRVLLRDSRAKVSHPAPNGLYHFVARALCTGSDLCVRDKWSGKASLLSAIRHMRNDLRTVEDRITSRSATLKATTMDIFLAYLLGVAFFSVSLIGYLTSFRYRRFIAQHFAI
jgi:glycosyltransferase involved in cell wall biosynthesis